jgi:hypothetical protein
MRTIMIYQIITYGRLCQSKKYFTDKKDVKNHIKSVIQKSLKHYASIHERVQLCNEDIEQGVRMLTINENILPDWEKLFGEEMKGILPPFDPNKKKIINKKEKENDI